MSGDFIVICFILILLFFFCHFVACDFTGFVFLTVYQVFCVGILLINEIKLTFTEHLPLLYVAKC